MLGVLIVSPSVTRLLHFTLVLVHDLRKTIVWLWAGLTPHLQDGQDNAVTQPQKGQTLGNYSQMWTQGKSLGDICSCLVIHHIHISAGNT